MLSTLFCYQQIAQFFPGGGPRTMNTVFGFSTPDHYITDVGDIQEWGKLLEQSCQSLKFVLSFQKVNY